MDAAAIKAAGDGSPDLEFLAAPAATVVNVAPGADGKISIPLGLLGKHPAVQVVVVDPLTTVSRVVHLPAVGLATVDLRLAKSLDPAGRPTKQKRVTLLQAGQELVLEDAASSRLEVVDTVEKAHRLLGTLVPDSRWAEFSSEPLGHVERSREERAVFDACVP